MGLAYMDDGLETPYERDEANDRIDIEAELGEGTACASDDGDEAVYAGHLVEKL